MKKCLEGKTYLVHWIDAHCENGWSKRGEMKDRLTDETLKMKTVGFFLKETKDSLSFTMSEDGDTVDYTMQIPKFAIKSIKQLF